MKSKTGDLSGLHIGDVICSIYSKSDKKWIRTLNDTDGNAIHIYKLVVERSLNGVNNWILCLLNKNPDLDKHIFYLDIDDTFMVKYYAKQID